MKFAQHSKKQILIAPTGATLATTTTTGLAQVDGQGYGYAHITLIAPAATNTSGANQPRAVTIQDSSTTDASNFGTYKVGTTNTVVGTSDFTIAANGNTEGFVQTYDVDIRSAKRYLRILVTPANSTSYTSLSCFAELSEGNGPNNALTEVI